LLGGRNQAGRLLSYWKNTTTKVPKKKEVQRKNNRKSPREGGKKVRGKNLKKGSNFVGGEKLAGRGRVVRTHLSGVRKTLKKDVRTHVRPAGSDVRKLCLCYACGDLHGGGGKNIWGNSEIINGGETRGEEITYAVGFLTGIDGLRGKERAFCRCDLETGINL